jgi:hypothetical protein
MKQQGCAAMSAVSQVTTASPRQLPRERIIDMMIELVGPFRSQRIIVAGARSRELMTQLHRRGHTRVETTASCGLPRGQCRLALLDGRLSSVRAIETTLCWLVHFLAPGSALVIGVDCSERGSNRRLAAMLERLGFEIEVVTRCESGVAFLARRRDAVAMDVAA